MALVLVRVDSRLIHGQVIEAWIPHTGADVLLVANDDLARNPSLRAVMELAVPRSVRAAFCAVADACRTLAELEARGGRVLLICATSADAVRLRQAGLSFSCLNIGNLHYAAGKVEITPSVYFAPEDFRAVEELRRCGISVDVRATPADRGVCFEGRGR